MTWSATLGANITKFSAQIKSRIISKSIKAISKVLQNNELIFKIQQRFKSERHDVFTEGINKISLSSKDENKHRSS